MADLVVPSASVVAGANAQKEKSRKAFEALAAGEVVIKRSVDGKVQRAKATDVNLKTVLGITLNDAAVNQPVDVQFGGTITLSVGTQGVPYFLSENLGGIAPLADLVTSGAGVRSLGVGTGTGLAMQVHNSGVDLP